ncbi:hypothetical protein CYK05_00855 [Rothia mucilaginosa]|nr:hypothetical protein HMPREF2944_03155 [Rothia sp. HMSC072E10]OFR48722.1 hypothetical protein HMPREF2884_05790 [Rothia sp. HMSC073B08]PLA62653.1 hypothetical protein CYK05_00855 [Rothia mucilaginosa]
MSDDFLALQLRVDHQPSRLLACARKETLHLGACLGLQCSDPSEGLLGSIERLHRGDVLRLGEVLKRALGRLAFDLEPRWR